MRKLIAILSILVSHVALANSGYINLPSMTLSGLPSSCPANEFADAIDANGNLSCAVPSGGGSGTVTSVGLLDASTNPLFTITNSPVTTSGTINETLVNFGAGFVLAGPTSGPSAQPGPRLLVASDIPNYYPLPSPSPSNEVPITNGSAYVLDPTTGTGSVVLSTTPTFVTNITDPLVIGGTGSGSSLSLESTSGTGSTDFIAFLTGSQTEKMRINRNGNVGIGTTSVNFPLEVLGQSGTIGQILVGNSDYVNVTSGTAIQIGPSVGSGNTSGKIQVINSGGAIGGNLGLNAIGGNVGIGTASPDAIFEVAGGFSGSSWTTNGAQTDIHGSVFTDTSGSGTIAARALNSIGQSTLSSTSAETITNAATLYIAAAPSPSPSVTITNLWALYIASGNLEIPSNGLFINGVQDYPVPSPSPSGAPLVSNGSAWVAGSAYQALPTPSPSAAFLQANGTSWVASATYQSIPTPSPSNAPLVTNGTAYIVGPTYDVLPTPSPSAYILTANGTSWVAASPTAAPAYTLPSPSPSAAVLINNGSAAVYSTVLFNSGSNVGIGTSSPTNTLQIGTTSSSGSTTPQTISIGGTFSSACGANPKLKVFDDGTLADAYGFGVCGGELDTIIPASEQEVWWIGGSQKMILNSAGNVGIGTTSPASALDVTNSVTGSTVAFRLRGGSAGDHLLAYTNTTAGNGENILSTNISENTYEPLLLRGSNISLFGNSGTGAYVDTNGNVGIGTTSPASILEVQSSFSGSSWTTSGILSDHHAGTYTDTSGSGTIATRVANSFGQPTFSSTNAENITTAATVYIAAAPSPSPSTTIVTSYALDVAAGATILNGPLTTTGAVTLTGISGGSGTDILCYAPSGGGVTYAANVVGCVPSDPKVKNKHADLVPEESLNEIMSLHPGSGTYKKETNLDQDEHVWLYADEVCNMDKRLCFPDSNGVLNYDKNGVIAKLVSAIQAQQSQIEELRKSCDRR